MKSKSTFLILTSALVALSNAATVQLTGGAGGIFNVTTGGVPIGTVAITGTNSNQGIVMGNATTGSDSIVFASLAGISTFTFNLNAPYMVDTAEFGTAGGLGNIGENTNRERPVGYAASFSGTATNVGGNAAFTLNSTITPGSVFTAPTAYTAGDWIVNTGFIPASAADEYVIQSGTGLGNAPIDYTQGLSNGGGDADSARFSFTVIPEPTSSALLGLGGLALLARRRR